MFDRIEITPPLSGEELRRKKISEWARKRQRRKNGWFSKCKKAWKPDQAYFDMVRDAFIAEGFPKTRIKFRKRQKLCILKIRCRGQRQVELILRRTYTPEKMAYFLKVFCQWDRSMRCVGGRSKRDPTKTPF